MDTRPLECLQVSDILCENAESIKSFSSSTQGFFEEHEDFIVSDSDETSIGVLQYLLFRTIILSYNLTIENKSYNPNSRCGEESCACCNIM